MIWQRWNEHLPVQLRLIDGHPSQLGLDLLRQVDAPRFLDVEKRIVVLLVNLKDLRQIIIDYKLSILFN